MAKKQKTPEQLAISAAMRKPARWWFASRRVCWVNGKTWGFFSNYKGFSFSCGTPKAKVHGEEVPESQFTMTFEWRPFRLVMFWHLKRICWIENWEWKKEFKLP